MFLFFGTDVFKHPRKYGIRLLKKRGPLYLSPGADFETDWMTKRDIAFVASKYKEAAVGTDACCERMRRAIVS